MNLRELDSFQNQIDRFFGNYNTFNPRSYTKPVDLYENNDEYKIVIDLPGVDKESINIESDAQTLEINMEKQEEKKETQINYHLKERINSNFKRKFKFSSFIDPSKSTINFENGLLTIIVPKAEDSKKISLNIN